MIIWAIVITLVVGNLLKLSINANYKNTRDKNTRDKNKRK